MPFETMWMDLESIMLHEINQTEKDKCYMISLICVILKKPKTTKLTDTENRLVGARGRGVAWEK